MKKIKSVFKYFKQEYPKKKFFKLAHINSEDFPQVEKLKDLLNLETNLGYYENEINQYTFSKINFQIIACQYARANNLEDMHVYKSLISVLTDWEQVEKQFPYLYKYIEEERPIHFVLYGTNSHLIFQNDVHLIDTEFTKKIFEEITEVLLISEVQ